MSVHLNREMDTQDQNAQRTEGLADYRHPVEPSYTLRENTLPSESVHGLSGLDRRSRSEKFKELRQLRAVEFCGATDPAEAETWLKRTERIFTLMRCTRVDQFDFAVSLLQVDAYDWWETVPNAMARPPVLIYDDFLREFRDRYMPEVYRDEKQREFLNLRQQTMTVAECEVWFAQLSR